MTSAHLPTGNVTFLFTDIEGSTRLLDHLGDAYHEIFEEHRRLLRAAFKAHRGHEISTAGDSFFVAFSRAYDAAAAALEAQRALLTHTWRGDAPVRVRMGIHSGEAKLTSGDYVGIAVHKAARISACAHGGQAVVSADTRALLGDSVPLIDLGEHRLKDFDDPVQLFQLGDGRFPPLRTISNTNLPHPASSFVGREREVTEVSSLLLDGARLLTLTGPGGSGKTRLAIEAAADLVPEFKAGVFWVGLAPLRDPALVTDTMAQTLGAKDGLAAHIAERELLLLLDNFEQVVDAAPELSSLLAACPNLKLLVTSRELLRVQGEIEYAVPPLAQPEAVQLFCTRSGMEAAETIAELCCRLDFLPLAVELAAARTSVLAPKQILERLSKRLDLLKGGRDADPRQATLRATIEWSYELLSEEEKALFARLAVFAGGCRLLSAEKVVGTDLDVLQSLVDKSLLRHTEDRFWMLETVREYALERLEASGKGEELRQRHSEHFLALAEEAEPNRRERPREWLDRLEREHDNLRAALDRLEASGENEPALRLVGALWPFWDERNHLAEGRHRLEGALRGAERPTAARANALTGAAAMALAGGDAATARVRAEEGLALHLTLGDAWSTAEAQRMLGVIVAEEGDWARAQQLLEESVRGFSNLGDEYNTMWAIGVLAWVYEGLGDRPRARALHEDNLRQARALRNEQQEAETLGALVNIALDDGRLQDALSMLKENHPLYRDLGDLGGAAVNLCRFARALVFAGKAATAARLLSCSERLCEEMGAHVLWVARMNEKTLTIIRTQLDEAAFAEAWEQGRTLTADEAVALALDALE